MTRNKRVKTACAVLVFCAVTAIAASAQDVTTVANFDGTDGTEAEGVLVQATNGSLYGTTSAGGDAPCIADETCGTVYEFTPGGKLITLHSFCAGSFPDCPDGAVPSAGLVQATDGNLYGTTWLGGTGPGSTNNVCGNESTTDGCGTVFKVTPAGKLTTIYNFCAQSNCSDGAFPTGGLIEAVNGKFYGTTSLWGISNGQDGYGTVFEITAEGELTTLHRFVGSDGSDANTLIQGRDGNFYGTTYDGGAYGVLGGKSGTVFKVTPAGKLTTLYSFCGYERCADGSDPSSLIQATDGNFYGTTLDNGAYLSGTIFKLTPLGKLTTLHTFCSVPPKCSDGFRPIGLVQATDGNFYGTTLSNGVNGGGTVFEITAEGTLTTLYSFDGFDGNLPNAGLLQATDGNFYGTTSSGGADRYGTLFRVSLGLGPFVAFVRDFGRIGQTGGILGQGFTGTTSVSINGIQANFKVVSDTFIRATVPRGATTGYVTVTTPGGTLTSNVSFHVIR